MWRGSAPVALMVLLAGCQRYPSGGDVRIRSDMVDQPSLRPQEDPRALPEGVVPVRGFEPPFTQAEAERDLQNPIPANEQARAQGRRLFSIYCAPCHGAAGRGDGPVAAKFSKPANLQDAKYAQAKDGFFYYVIRYGTPMMPPKAESLEPHERWQVIHHVRALPRR